MTVVFLREVLRPTKFPQEPHRRNEHVVRDSLVPGGFDPIRIALTDRGAGPRRCFRPSQCRWPARWVAGAWGAGVDEIRLGSHLRRAPATAKPAPRRARSASAPCAQSENLPHA